MGREDQRDVIPVFVPELMSRGVVDVFGSWLPTADTTVLLEF